MDALLPARIEALRVALRRQPTLPARTAWLVEQSRGTPALADAERIDRHLVPGCLSRLWLVAEEREGRCWFRGDSDSQIVRAVAAALCALASGCTPEELAAASADVPAQTGLDRLLTTNRRAAQSRVWEFIRRFAADQAGRRSLCPEAAG